MKSAKQVLDKIEIENIVHAKITSRERDENRRWNAVAMREAIINAFVHNDYTTEVPPKFEIFDDRIEITSAGGLPDGLSLDEFFEGYSVPRNKEIMRIFKDLDLVEQLGSGVPRILESYGKECFKFSTNFLRMTFPNADYVTDYVTDYVSDVTEDYLVDKKEQVIFLSDSELAVMQVELKKYKLSKNQIQVYFLTAQQLSSQQIKILHFAISPKSNREIQEECLGLKRHSDNFSNYIEPLLSINGLARTIPGTPKSRLQKYYTTLVGEIMIMILDHLPN